MFQASTLFGPARPCWALLGWLLALLAAGLQVFGAVEVLWLLHGCLQLQAQSTQVWPVGRRDSSSRGD
jgi:hypothetical protein